MGKSFNVYLLQDGDRVSLINAGHPAHYDSLLQAFKELEISPADVDRIAVTSWEISAIGGAPRFPQADLFVLSPDMEAPRDLERKIDGLRQRLESLAQEFCDVLGYKNEDFKAPLERYYPRVSRDLRFIPLRNGHRLSLGGQLFEVLATPGPGPGHLSLFCADNGALFSGDFALSGFPDQIDNARAYLQSMERLAGLASTRVYPNRGRSFTRGPLTLGRSAKFVDNFLGNVSAAVIDSPTVLEFIERDLGRRPEAPMDLLFTHQVFQALFDELVRTRNIGAEGEGIHRRYGVDVEDHRKEIRR